MHGGLGHVVLPLRQLEKSPLRDHFGFGTAGKNYHGLASWQHGARASSTRSDASRCSSQRHTSARLPNKTLTLAASTFTTATSLSPSASKSPSARSIGPASTPKRRASPKLP